MQQPIVFCPKCANLILQNAHCDNPKCNWKRPSLGGEPGSQLWKHQLSNVPGAPYSQPASHNGLLFVAIETGDKYGAKQGSIVALSADSHEEVWTKPIPNQRVARLLKIAGNHLLVATEDTRAIGTDDNVLLALDPATGNEQWQFLISAHSMSAPAVNNGLVFFTTNNRTGYGLELDSGALRWQVKELPSWTPSPPAVGPDAFYIGSRENKVMAITSSGKAQLIWQAAEDNNWFPHAPAYQAGTLYVTAWDKQLYALDVKTCQKRWAVPIGRGHTTPPVVGEYVYVGAKEKTKRAYSMQAINPADGAVVWRFPAGRHFNAPPLLHQNLLFAPCDDGHLYVLDAKTGQSQWQYPVGDERVDKLRSVPVISENTVTCIDRKGMVYALSWQQPTTTENWPNVSELRKQGDWETAGSVAAWHGDYEVAADDYMKAQLPYQAAQLYEKSGRFAKAADSYLALDADTYHQAADKAVVAYQQAGDQMGEARALVGAKRAKEGAELYEELQHYQLAADAFEDAGLMRQAALCHTMASNYDRAIEIYEAMEDKKSVAAVYHTMGDLDRAVDILESIGDVIEAAKWLQEAHRSADAAVLLEKHHHIEQAVAVWLEMGDRESATAVYTRTEQWEKAAQLWEAQDYARAADFYLQANQLLKAANLYHKTHDYKKARTLYDKLNNATKVAEMAEKMQDYLGAAAAYLQTPLPKLQDVARCYALAQKWDKAAEFFEKAGDRFVDDAVQNWCKAGQPERAVTLLHDNHRLPEAAQLLEKEQQYEEAAKLWLAMSPPNNQEAARLYQLAGMPDQAIQLLSDTGQWQDVLRVAQEVNDYEREAEACVKLASQEHGEKKEDLYFAAAQAYQRAAEVYESNKKLLPNMLAELWEKALTYYEESYEDRYLPHCQSEIARLRRRPVLEVEIRAEQRLIEKERHNLLIIIRNAGYGTADMIFMRVVGGDFKDQGFQTQHIRGLRRTREKEFIFGVVPMIAGSAVSLKMEISYRSPDGKEHMLPVDGRLSVQRRDSQRMTPHELWGDTPLPQGTQQQIIIVKEGGKVNVGDTIIKGDNVEAGGQKGDKVEINKRDGIGIQTSTNETYPNSTQNEALCPDSPDGQHDFGQGQYCRYCSKLKTKNKQDYQIDAVMPSYVQVNHPFDFTVVITPQDFSDIQAQNIDLETQVWSEACGQDLPLKQQVQITTEQPSPKILIQKLTPKLAGNISIIVSIYQDANMLLGSRLQPKAIDDIDAVEQNTEVRQTKFSLSSQELADLLHEYFNMNELEALCFELDIDPEDITISHRANKQEFCIRLVKFCYRKKIAEKLVEACLEKRPHINNIT